MTVREETLALLRIIYAALCVCLSLYGLYSFSLIYLYLVHRRKESDLPPLHHFPPITVQLPLYNERYVARRAINALARLDWPRERLQIQVVDDSTDDTTSIARQCVAELRRQGLDIVLLHRGRRTGFKAGALNEAMRQARGEFIALFDADFVPPADFLYRTIPYLLADPELGFVQARWGHLNDEFSLFTLAQALALDGHFAVEHVAREAIGAPAIFNGSGGVWRRRCIEECGGWDPTMLTEDIDLSYRAWLSGWRGLTLPDLVVPAEIPVQLAAFKQQQFRWARGDTHCFIRLTRRLLCAPASLLSRLQGLIYLGYYWAHPLMLVVMLLSLPLIWYGYADIGPLAFLGMMTLGPPLMYAMAQRILYPRWWRRLRGLPILVFLGIGLALNSTAAIVETLLGVPGYFQRTPKLQIEGRGPDRRAVHYSLPADPLLWGELALTAYALLTVFAALVRGQPLAVPFLSLYVLGFGYIGALGLLEAIRSWQRHEKSPVT